MVIVIFKSIQINLELISKKLKAAGFKIIIEKFFFIKDGSEYLCFKISGERTMPLADEVQAKKDEYLQHNKSYSKAW